MTPLKNLFWWIDDDPDRIKIQLVKDRIERPRHPGMRTARATLVIKQITQGDWSAVETELADTSAASQPDLLIIDQRLGLVQHAHKLGSSLAVALRAQRPSVPIVLVSADAAPHPVLSQQRREGIDFIRVEDLQSGLRVPDLFAIASGFKRVIDAGIVSDEGKQRTALMKLLAVPEAERDTFLHCLPHEFLQAWDAETPHRFARWVWNDLMGRSGFLLDDLDVATQLGLGVSALGRVEKILQPCLYGGCFASVARKRWWITLVRQEVRRKTEGGLSDPLALLGRKLVPKRRSLYSRAYGRDEEGVIPDCVAFIDGRLKERAPALREDTGTLPYELPAPGFDPVRVFKGAEQ